MIERESLVRAICERPEPIIVVEAPAGMGKSVLLGQVACRLDAEIVFDRSIAPARGTVLWDLGTRTDAAPLDEAFVSGGHRLVVAKRPECVIPGLSRAHAYGTAFRLDPGTLLFSARELRQKFDARTTRRILAGSGGWPALADPLPDEAGIRTFFATCLLADMPAAVLIGLGEMLAGHAVPADLRAALNPIIVEEPQGEIKVIGSILDKPLRAAQAETLERRMADPSDADELADAFLSLGRPTEAITTLQKTGQHQRVLDVFVAERGLYYLYAHGQDACAAVLAGFPEPFILEHEPLWAALCLQALKRGDVSRALHILQEALGPDALDHEYVFSHPERYSLATRHLRLLLLGYEDFTITEPLLDLAYRILDEIPIDAHLLRGSFYNAVVELYFRLNRLPEVEEVATRARECYRRAHMPMLEFYSILDQMQNRLMLGEADEAHKLIEEAADSLSKVGYPTPADHRFLNLLDACIEYERGHLEPLAIFLDTEFEEFSQGEIWTSIVDFALLYGGLALSEHFSIVHALNFLDRWRVYQHQNKQLQTLIDVREATILQNGNRWQEAAERLSAIPSRIDRTYVLSNPEALSRLDQRDDLALALAWLRQILFESPDKPQLFAAVMALRNNLRLFARQRASLDIWLAYVHKRRRDLTKVRAILQKSLETAARRGTVAPLFEERFFLTELIDSQRVSEFLDTSPPTRQVIRRLREIGLPEGAPGSHTGLTRRETKIVLMIAEGASNKHVAQVLGLSEATVKFHLGNAYRKLGCQNRREAIGAARTFGLVS